MTESFPRGPPSCAQSGSTLSLTKCGRDPGAAAEHPPGFPVLITHLSELQALWPGPRLIPEKSCLSPFISVSPAQVIHTHCLAQQC